MSDPNNPNEGIGTATPLAPNTATYQEQVAGLRAQGISQDAINQGAINAVAAARQQGHSEEDITKALGINDPAQLHEILRTHALPALNTWTAPTAEGVGQSLVAGVEGSSGGLAYRGELPEFQMPENAGFWGSTAYAAGTMLGSLADTITGAVVGGGMGVAAGLPTGPGAAVTGATLATMGAFTLPAVRREAYMQALVKGQVQNWSDFAEREASITWEGVKAATIAKFTAGAGKAAEKIGGPAFIEGMRKIAVETAAMTGTQAALDGQLPDWNSLGAGAVTMLGIHVATAPTRMSAGAGRVIMANLADNWVKTGEDPAAAATRATHDEFLYQRLSLPHPAEPPPRSSETPVDRDVYVVGRETAEHPVTPAPDVAPDGTPIYEPPTATDWGRTEVPPDQPTEFEKGRTFYDANMYFEPLRWSESKKSWMYAADLTEEDWKYQNTLHEPPVGVANSNMTSWWHGSDQMQPSLQPLGYNGGIHAVWLASDRSVAEGFTGPERTGTITRVHVLPGKYFDPRDPEQMEHATSWFNDNYPVFAERMTTDLAGAHYTVMQRGVMQEYLTSNGYDGYFERESLSAHTPVNLAVYNADKIVRGDTTDIRKQAARVGHYEQSSPNSPEDMKRPGTLLAVYEHGQKPEPGTIQPLGLGKGGGEPPEKPPETPAGGAPKLPPPPKTDAELIQQTADELRTPTQPGWFTRTRIFMRDAYRDICNIAHPVNQIVDKAIERGIPIPGANNPEFLNRLASRATADTVATQQIVQRMLPILKPFAGESGPDNFWTYTMARTRMADALAKRPNPPTEEQVARWKRVVELGNNKYADAFDKLRDFHNDSLKLLVGTRITEAQYRGMLALGDAGLPLIRGEAEGAPEHARTQPDASSGGARRTIFARKGSDLPVLQQGHVIIGRWLARTYTALADARTNATVDLGLQTGEAVEVNSTKADWSAQELQDMGIAAGGDDAADIKIIAKRLGWELRGDDVVRWKDGVATQVRFQDPGVARMLNNMDRQGHSIYQRLMTPYVNFTRGMMTTANPLFGPRILGAYDMLTQHVMNPEGRNTVATAMEGVRALFTPEIYDKAVASGAITHVFHTLGNDKYVQKVLQGKEDPEFHANVWNVIKSPVDALRAWTSAFFHILPLGRFSQGLTEGEDLTTAAAKATDYAFDPANSTGPSTDLINATTQPFFRAYINSYNRLLKSALGIGHSLGGQKYSAADFAAKAIPFVTVPFIQSYIKNKDKQWYKNTPDWQKNSGLPVHWGPDGPGGVTAYIPFPPMLGLIYGGLPRMVVQAIDEGNPHAFSHMGSTMLGAVAPPTGAFTYSVLQPAIEKIANYSFFRGRPLNPNITAQPQEKFTPWTSWTARKIASGIDATPVLKWSNMTPVEVDNFVSGLSGAAGRFIVQGADKAAQYLHIAPDTTPAESIWDWPGFSSFHVRSGGGGQPVSDFLDGMKQIATDHGSASIALAKGDPDRFKELTQEDPAAFLSKFGNAPTAAANPRQFMDMLDAAAQKLGTKLDPASRMLRADQLIKLDREAIGFIGALPNSAQLSDSQRQTLMGYQRAIATLQPGVNPLDLATISSVDKKQLLDRIYATMSLTAQSGLRAMDEVRAK